MDFNFNPLDASPFFGYDFADDHTHDFSPNEHANDHSQTYSSHQTPFFDNPAYSMTEVDLGALGLASPIRQRVVRSQEQQQQQQQQHQQVSQAFSNSTMPHCSQAGSGMPYSALAPSEELEQVMGMGHAITYGWNGQAHQHFSHEATPDNSYGVAPFNNMPLHPSPASLVPATGAERMLPIHVSGASMPSTSQLPMAMNALGFPEGRFMSAGGLAYPFATQNMMNGWAFDLSGTHQIPRGSLNLDTSFVGMHHAQPSSSPSSASAAVDVSSLAGSDAGWSNVNLFQTNAHVYNPGETLHHRSESNSSVDESPADIPGYEPDVFAQGWSPESDSHGYEFIQPAHAMSPPFMTRQSSDQTHDRSPNSLSSPTSVIIAPLQSIRPATSSSTSSSPPTSSPPATIVRRRRSPTGPTTIGKTTKPTIKKSNTAPSSAALKAVLTEKARDKKVGRRRGPLKPDQRQSASEIRKLRACIRCRCLKKTCDPGDPCHGCKPAHARLWQVPCTRIDIKDLNYFMKDWTVDYQRHVSLGFSIANIKGFSSNEKPIYITHGYGFMLQIKARQVYTISDECFNVDWTESLTNSSFECDTAKLSTGQDGVDADQLSAYIDKHLDEGHFHKFVDDYFENTQFLTEMLHTAYTYYEKKRTPVVRKALKLIIAYGLTQHITMADGLSEEEQVNGRIDDESSRWSGRFLAPVMISFEVKCALAKLWRELQKEVLEDLSSLYTAVYQGERMQKWPTIFMVASLLLAVWELMQFDCHYREPDTNKVDKFVTEMESTPVGVVVGLFQAISQKLPSLLEWDSEKHGDLLLKDAPICDALTELKGHVSKHEAYLRGRTEAKYDRNDFDCLSNKFLSRMMIKAS